MGGEHERRPLYRYVRTSVRGLERMGWGWAFLREVERRGVLILARLGGSV